MLSVIFIKLTCQKSSSQVALLNVKFSERSWFIQIFDPFVNFCLFSHTGTFAQSPQLPVPVFLSLDSFIIAAQYHFTSLLQIFITFFSIIVKKKLVFVVYFVPE